MRIDESYPVYGVHAQARNRCNETVIPLRGAGIGYELIVRSYDDGAAVRYRDRFEAETSPRSRADCMESACHGSLFLGALFDRLRKPAIRSLCFRIFPQAKHWSIR